MSIPAAYLGVILIWSTTPLAIQWSSIGTGFIFGVSARIVIGALVVLALLWLMRHPVPWHKQARQTYYSASLGIYGSMICVYWGAQFIPSGLVSVIFGLTPLMVGIFAGPLLGERALTPARLTGIIIGIAGLTLIFRTDIKIGASGILGIAAITAGVMLHALSTVLVKKVDARLSTLSTNGGSLTVSGIMFLLTWLILGAEVPEQVSMRAGASILYLGIIGSVIGFSLFFYALRHLDATKMGLVPMITPVLALLLGQGLNGEVIDPTVWTGTAFIIAGLGIYQWGHRIPVPVLRRY